MKLENLKITIEGEKLDLEELVEMNDGEPLEVTDILDKVKYELEGILNKQLDHIRIVDTSRGGGFF